MNNWQWRSAARLYGLSFKMTGIITIACSVGLAQKDRRVTKSSPIAIESLTDPDSLVTWSDINEMKLALYGMASVFVVWAASQIWANFQKKQDKTSDSLEQLISAVQRIEAHLEHVPTREEVLKSILEYRKKSEE